LKLFGLIGHPVSHSFSKSFFEKKFINENIMDCCYDLIDIKSLKEIEALKLNNTFSGLNVTIPYKKTIFPFLDWISEDAMTIGAVNTIKISDEKWYGYNTDVIGFEKSLLPLINTNVKNALILGSGGASLAVQYILNKLNISLTIVSRFKTNGQLNYEELSETLLNNHQLIINTTPLGMFPHIHEVPNIPDHFLNKNHIVYDLIYNPEETLLLKNALINGCKVKNGLQMLHLQAEESWKIWNE